MEPTSEPVVLVVPAHGFSGAPFLAVVSRLQDAGVAFVAASEEAGICRATDGVRVTASRAFDYPALLELPALIVFGDGDGWLGRSPGLKRLLKRAAERGMIVGAVGRGVATLAAAGLLRGHEVAAEPELDELLLRAGAVPLRTAVVLSGRIVTASDMRAGALADELLRLVGVRPLPIELR
jgi:putative intracellular protease/amidase